MLFAYFSAFAHSETFYSKSSVVSNLSLGGSSFSGFRVKLQTMEDPAQGFNHNTWYMYEYVDGNVNYNALLLAAYMPNKAIDVSVEDTKADADGNCVITKYESECWFLICINKNKTYID